jgi:hypothetical protein
VFENRVLRKTFGPGRDEQQNAGEITKMMWSFITSTMVETVLEGSIKEDEGRTYNTNRREVHSKSSSKDLAL